MNNELRQSVLKTLAWFDVFDYALTKEELYTYLWQPPKCTYEEVVKRIEWIDDVERKDGFIFLKNKQKNVIVRQQAVKHIEKKMRIAKRAVKKLRWIPFVRAIFVCNTVACGYPDKNSDIDIFVVAKEDRIWLTRFFVTLTLSMFRLRRTKKTIRNKICLSFYITDNSLNLQSVAIDEDIYVMYWLVTLIPIYDPQNLREKVMEENNWVWKNIPHANAPYTLANKYSVSDSQVSKKWKIFWEKAWKGMYGNILNTQAKEIQKIRMKFNIFSAQKENNTNVVVSDTILKFHENDRREKYRDEWRDKCVTLPL